MRDIFFPKTMTIRMPNLMTKLIAAEVAKRNFIKKNGQSNENEFFNKMLPNMLAFRAYKKGFLREYLEKNIKACINEGMQEKILDFLAESFDYLYFDESEYENDDKINLRFDVKNEFLYAELFVRLDNMGIKKSSYIRNLIHEYCTQSEYQKERICFNEEYLELKKAIENNFVVQFSCDNEIIKAIVTSLEFSVTSEHWYLIYLVHGAMDKIYSIPLYKIRNVLLLHDLDIGVPKDVCIQINSIIEDGEFDKVESFQIGGTADA